MPEVIVDSTAIILLSNIGHLWLIEELYEEIYRVSGEKASLNNRRDTFLM